MILLFNVEKVSNTANIEQGSWEPAKDNIHNIQMTNKGSNITKSPQAYSEQTRQWTGWGWAGNPGVAGRNPDARPVLSPVEWEVGTADSTKQSKNKNWAKPPRRVNTPHKLYIKSSQNSKEYKLKSPWKPQAGGGESGIFSIHIFI